MQGVSAKKGTLRLSGSGSAPKWNIVSKLQEELGHHHAYSVLGDAVRLRGKTSKMKMDYFRYTETELICSVLITRFNLLDDKDVFAHLVKAYKAKLAGQRGTGASAVDRTSPPPVEGVASGVFGSNLAPR